MDFDETLAFETAEESERRGRQFTDPDTNTFEALGYAAGIDGAYIARCAEQIAGLHAEVESLKSRLASLESS